MVRMDAGLSWSGRASDVQPAGNPQEVLGDPADCRARARSRRSYGRVSQRSLPLDEAGLREPTRALAKARLVPMLETVAKRGGLPRLLQSLKP